MKRECQCLLFLKQSQYMNLLFIQLQMLCKARTICSYFCALCLEMDCFICISYTYMLHFLHYKLDVLLQRCWQRANLGLDAFRVVFRQKCFSVVLGWSRPRRYTGCTGLGWHRCLLCSHVGTRPSSLQAGSYEGGCPKWENKGQRHGLQLLEPWSKQLREQG